MATKPIYADFPTRFSTLEADAKRVIAYTKILNDEDLDEETRNIFSFKTGLRLRRMEMELDRIKKFLELTLDADAAADISDAVGAGE